MRVIKSSRGLVVPGILFFVLALVTACGSREPALRSESTGTAPAQPVPRPASAPAVPADPGYAGSGVSLDGALSDIAAYYAESLPSNAKIALLNFESEARLLSDYIFEELWIRFEDRSSFVMVERRNLELIQRELEYQYSGPVSEESALSISNQFGPQTLVYGKITRLGGEYRLVVYATDVERAVTGIRSAAVIPDRRFAALLETPPAGPAGMADALYSGLGNPWRFTARTDRPGGDYRDGDYMTLHIYSEKDAWFKVTHIDVNGSAQVIYPVSPRDNNFIRAGETRRIPDNTRFRMTAPYGEEMILAGAYEKPFTVQGGSAAPLSNRLLVRGMTVESEDTRTDMRPVAAAKFTYRIGP
jgi:hypothetical protein